jgi:hypothetical protein
MTTEWEKYSEFVDDTGTKFFRLSEDTYRFVTKEGYEDICNKSQMLEWNIKVFTYIK